MLKSQINDKLKTQKMHNDELIMKNKKKIEKMKEFSIKSKLDRNVLKNKIKTSSFNNNLAKKLGAISILCGIAIGSMGGISSYSDNNTMMKDSQDGSSYKINMTKLNQDENIRLGGVDIREEIGKEYEAITEIDKNIGSIESKYGTIKYILVETKNGNVVFTEQLPNEKINKENIKNLNNYFINEGKKFDNIEQIKTQYFLPPKDLYSALEIAYLKRGLDTSSLKNLFKNSSIKVDKITGESKTIINIDNTNTTNKQNKIVDIITKYYGNNVYINGLNVKGEIFIDNNKYFTFSVNF